MTSPQSDVFDENTSLLNEKKKNTGNVYKEHKPIRIKRSFFGYFLLLCGALVLCLGVAYLTYHEHGAKEYSFTALNEYGTFATEYPFAGKYEFVEPHLGTTLTATSNGSPLRSTNVAWEVETSSGTYEYPTGNPVIVNFNSTGKLAVKWCKSSIVTDTRRLSNEDMPSIISRIIDFILSYYWTDLSGGDQHLDRGSSSSSSFSELATTSGTAYVFCLYVRRELRTLSTSDRDAFFEASEIVFRLPTEEGQALYGTKYYSAGYYGDKHNILSGNSDCDHIHDGLGFITSHGALTLMYEQTLQAINPRVTVPYWDYTIDITSYEISGDLDSFFGSEVFGADYFGTAITTQSYGDDDLTLDGFVNPSGRILTGRFTQVEVSLDYWGLTSDVYNAYGHIRAPWNNNNDPYVNRFNTTYGFCAVGSNGARRRRTSVSTSSSAVREEKELVNSMKRHRKLEGSSVEFGSVDCGTVYTAMQYATWYDFGKKIEYQPHGPIHTLIGGVYGADYKTAIESRANVDSKFIEAWALLAFGLFKDMWRAGKVNCPTSCSDDTPVSKCKCFCPFLDSWTTNSSHAKSILTAIDPQIFGNPEFTTDEDGNDISILILKILCNDYDELNPVIGESLQSSSPLDITFWPTHPFIDRLFHWKLIHTGFFNTAWGPGGNDVNSSCYGHSKMDQVGWKNLWDADDYEYTNIEIYEKCDPTMKNVEDYGLSYVYDNFRWEHCTSMGYPATLFSDDKDDDFL